MNDLNNLTNEELDNARVEILVEQERRDKIAAIPEQITELRNQYTAAGGDPADLDKE